MSEQSPAVIKIHETTVIPQKNLNIISYGNGNQVVIERKCAISRLKVTFLGNNNQLIIGKIVKANLVCVFKGDNNSITVSPFVGLVEAHFHAEYGTKITIGENGIFSRGLVVRTGDSHSVIDIQSGQRTNMPDDVVIGPWVWAGFDVCIQKGVTIEPHTIIAARSVVTKSPRVGQCVLAGMPANVVRTGVMWDRRSLDKTPPDDFMSDIIASRNIKTNGLQPSESEKNIPKYSWMLFALFFSILLSIISIILTLVK